jgi:hypothetical protein
LAASLYHARKVSFASAAHLAGLSFEGFRYRLEEHFDKAYIIADESVLEDIFPRHCFNIRQQIPKLAIIYFYAFI